MRISRDKDGKTRVAKGDKSGLGGQYAPDVLKLRNAENRMKEFSNILNEKTETSSKNIGVVSTPDELLQYLKNAKAAQANKTQAVLKLLLEHPEGLTRCCLTDKLRQKGILVGQLAAQVRELRRAGVNIPKNQNGQCLIHNNSSVTLDIIVKPYIAGNDYARAKYTSKELATMRKIFDDTDAFTGIRSSTNMEVDHRIPVGRMAVSDESIETKVDVSDVNAVKEKYQLLTREMNLHKSRVCEKCVETNIKPSVFLGIPVPRVAGGGEPFVDGKNDCSTCPYAFPEKFIAKLQHADEPISKD